MIPLYLYNSLSRKKEEFVPNNPPDVSLYTCGITAYESTHIGHIKKYIGDDILRRVLEFNSYKVKHVQNVTDVGHLVSDADEGEDKLEKGAKKYGMKVLDLARKFEKEFYEQMDSINVLRPHVIKRAADDDSVSWQIENVKKLVDKGFAYVTDAAIYFDVSKLPDYNPFSSQPLKDKLAGAREGVEVDKNKKNPADFALWIFRKGKHANHALHWDSAWGDGFPGWHIECSSIGLKCLGESIDIHTGGIDHKEIHHPAEIAQNIGITGHSVVKYWVHHEFLQVDGRKMSKSLNNFYTLGDVEEKAYDPLALRYFVLGTHYRKQINFTWDALKSASRALENLRKKKLSVSEHSFDKDEREAIRNDPAHIGQAYFQKFLQAINDDLNIPQGLAVMWKVLEDTALEDKTKALLISEFDKVLGLNIYTGEGDDSEEIHIPIENLPEDAQNKLKQREEYRKQKKFSEADLVRKQIEGMGYKVEDSKEGVLISKKP